MVTFFITLSEGLRKQYNGVNYLDQLRELEQGYHPAPEVTSAIGDKSLLAFIGPFAVGKTTLIHEIARADERFSEVVSFTTRPPRGPDDTYRFMNDTVANIERLTEKARGGELVNFAVHATTGYVYGTEIGDYRTEYCMLATTANNFELSTSKLPFRSVEPIAVVVDPHVWADRLRQRAMSESDFRNRLNEAKQSLKWILNSDNISFIDNTDGHVKGTGARFALNFAAGKTTADRWSRDVAESMLSYVDEQKQYEDRGASGFD